MPRPPERFADLRPRWAPGAAQLSFTVDWDLPIRNLARIELLGKNGLFAEGRLMRLSASEAMYTRFRA